MPHEPPDFEVFAMEARLLAKHLRDSDIPQVKPAEGGASADDFLVDFLGWFAPKSCIFIQRHKMWCRLVCVGPGRGRQSRPDWLELYRMLQTDFAECSLQRHLWGLVAGPGNSSHPNV